MSETFRQKQYEQAEPIPAKFLLPDGSISDEIPGSGFISEMGTNFIKFKNGYGMCWGREGTGTRQVGRKITFPIRFQVVPSVFTNIFDIEPVSRKKEWAQAFGVSGTGFYPVQLYEDDRGYINTNGQRGVMWFAVGQLLNISVQSETGDEE